MLLFAYYQMYSHYLVNPSLYLFHLRLPQHSSLI